MATKRTIRKNSTCSVQMTNLRNFVENVIPSLYIAPANQRPHKNANADQFFAFLIYWAVKAKMFAKNAAKALPGCTIVSDGMKPIMMSISIRDGQVYIQDGQHRYFWSLAIFDNAVEVSSSTGNIEVDKVVSDYAGLTFNELPKWLQNGIFEALVMLEVVDTDDVEMEKVLFDDKNRGSSMKTHESLNNNFCNVPIYQQLQTAVEEIKDGTLTSFTTKYPIGLKYLKNSVKKEAALFHLITRCMTMGTKTKGAKACDVEAMSMNCTLSQSQAHAFVQEIIDNLCLGANIVGPNRAINTYAGAYVYAISNKKMARRANTKKYRYDMHDAIYDFEQSYHSVKTSVVNAAFLSNTTHDKNRVKYAASQIEGIAAKVVI